MSVSAERVRELKGQLVMLRLSPEWGGGDLRGTLVNFLDSADGLVVYVRDGAGATHTVHYQHIVEAEPAS